MCGQVQSRNPFFKARLAIAKKLGKVHRRKKLTSSERRKVLEASNYTCANVRCGSKIDPSVPNSYSIDHIVPLVLGGVNEMFNYQVLCSKCEAEKGGKVSI